MELKDDIVRLCLSSKIRVEMDLPSIRAYNDRAAEFADQYNALSTEQLHPRLRELIAGQRLAVLDLGAGAGRDAAWLSALGHEVSAIEPAANLRDIAAQAYSGKPIAWFDDLLPKLDRTIRAGHTFDFILLSAVWMHIPPEQRENAFRALVQVVRPNGRLLITLRHGPSPADRPMFPVSLAELQKLASANMAYAKELKTAQSKDQLKRSEVSWQSVLVTIPDGYQRGLEILRQELFFARKSSSYKLGLVRAVLNAVQKKNGGLHFIDDYRATLPMSSVVTAWAEIYGGLLAFGVPPRSRRLRESLPVLTGEEIAGIRDGCVSREVRSALLAVRDVIRDNPMAHMFEDRRKGTALFGFVPDPAGADDRTLDAELGQMILSRRLAETLLSHSALISAGLLSEWRKFIADHPQRI